MLRFCGFDLELTVDTIVDRDRQAPGVFGATDSSGDHWLILEAGGHDHASWICAPVSDRVVELVAAGQADAADAVRHSITGWVEVVRVVDGHAVPEQRVPCTELAHLLDTVV